MKTPSPAWRRLRPLGRLAALAFAAWRPAPAAGAENPVDASLPTSGRVVELPPFMVEETEKHSPWLYGRLEGFEILSRCSEVATDRFMEQVYRAQQLFNALVPPELHPPMSAPTTYLIYDDTMKQAVPPEVLRAMTHVNFTPNFMLTDADELQVLALVPRSSRRPEDLVLTPGSVRFMLSKRVPAPPYWFIEGFAAFYDEQEGSTAETFRFSRARWISNDLTDSIRQNPEFPRPLLPLAELFSPYLSAAAHSDGRFASVWRSEAALFIRWALDRPTAAGRSALWKFVDGASAGPVTEEFFQECFGLNYADMFERLADYIPTAIARPLEIACGDLPEMPGFELRRATDSEVSRITGEWERLEVNYVRVGYPPLVGKYLDQARLTVQAAYSRGERDPGLLAVMGLDALDAGETAKAREFLDGAARGGVARPRVYAELARLRYNDARLIPAGAGGLLSAGQVASVLDPLERGRRLQPELPEAYDLASDVWLHTAEKATPEQRTLLDEGVRLFPGNLPLLLKVTAIAIKQGQKANAAVLLAQGLRLAPAGLIRDRFLALQKYLGRPVAPPLK